MLAEGRDPGDGLGTLKVDEAVGAHLVVDQ